MTLEAQRWREETRNALEGLGAAIDREFAKWGLTEAERDVALLLLKGLSHKEIADAGHTNEGTVRQQALGIVPAGIVLNAVPESQAPSYGYGYAPVPQKQTVAP